VAESQDATEEVKQNEAHHSQLSSAETYRILVSTLRDYAVFMLDPQGYITTWNTGASLLKQYTQEEIIGKHFSQFYNEEDRKARKPEKELELALRDGKVEDEGWRVRKDGSRFWANVIITPIYRDGKLTGFSKVTRDLTERKATETRLIAAYEEASKMKSDFLANMSHEIRTPMHGIMSALSLLIDTGLTREQKELADIIGESGSILLQVINDILDYSKLTSGSFLISKEVINIADIVTAVQRCFKIGSKSGLSFEVELDPHLPTFGQGDPLRYRQILQNLISNAIKFTEQGYIRVKTILTHEDEISYSVRTEVSDTGIGVQPELENLLFTPFTQLDNFTTKRYKGTGLGLSICKSLVELMGGVIGFAHNPEQTGSVFYFTAKIGKLNCSVNTQMVVPIPDVDIRQVAQEKQLLLAEDNAINQAMMVRLLRGLGFEKVDVAWDGAEALRLIKQKPLSYNLVLMDISMPVMDGVTATKHIRLLRQNIPIVAMTAHAMKGDEETYLAEGMNDYITKPVDRRLLINVLLRWLQ
jgi:osomolarity two-component system sensor histidine kinase TcsA